MKRPRSGVASLLLTILVVVGIVCGFWLVLFALAWLSDILLAAWVD